MTTSASFLADIIAHHPDDTPRLIYADWLEDPDAHGRGTVTDSDRVRAEFIRVQCELAGLGNPHPYGSTEQQADFRRVGDAGRRRAAALRRRERELLTLHAYDWLAHLIPPGVMLHGCDRDTYSFTSEHGRRDSTFRRGFVEHIECSAADFLRHADALRAATPVREVVLTTMPDIPEGLWIHTPPHVSRGPVFEIAGVMVEGPSHEEWRLPEHLPGRTTEWYAEMLRRRFPGITFTLPPARQIYGSGTRR